MTNPTNLVFLRKQCRTSRHLDTQPTETSVFHEGKNLRLGRGSLPSSFALLSLSLSAGVFFLFSSLFMLPPAAKYPRMSIRTASNQLLTCVASQSTWGSYWKFHWWTSIISAFFSEAKYPFVLKLRIYCTSWVRTHLRLPEISFDESESDNHLKSWTVFRN